MLVCVKTLHEQLTGQPPVVILYVAKAVTLCGWRLTQSGKVLSPNILDAQVFMARLRRRTPIRFIRSPVFAMSFTNKCPVENAMELGGVDTGSMKA